MSNPLIVAEEDRFFTLKMDDGKANALSFAMLDALNDGFERAEACGKPVVLMGRPGRFSAGFDLTVMARQDADTHRLLRTGADLALRLFTFPTPIVAAVTGHAIAMGALLCLSVDYRVGTRGDFKLGLNEVAIGMTLPWFGCALAEARLAGHWRARAVDLAMLCQPEVAVEAGFIDEAVASDEVDQRVTTLAETFSQLDMKAHRETKLRQREAALKALQAALSRDFASA